MSTINISTTTGLIATLEYLPPERTRRDFILGKGGNRDLTPAEHLEWQSKLYSPCTCGSGKKFKFCCKK